MTDQEFDTYMTGLDGRLKAQGVAVHRGPFFALTEASICASQSRLTTRSPSAFVPGSSVSMAIGWP
jgi:hypothetical protein